MFPVRIAVGVFGTEAGYFRPSRSRVRSSRLVFVESFALDGQWTFYWQQYIAADGKSGGGAADDPNVTVQVPGYWTSVESGGRPHSGTGYASYRLKLKLPPGGERLALKIDRIYSSYRLFVNGEQLYEMGNPGKSPAETVTRYSYPHVIALDRLEDAQELDLIIHAANFTYTKGGIDLSVELGTKDQLERMQDNELAVDLFIFGALLLIAVYHFAFYLLRRRKNVSALYFALICLVIAVRTLCVHSRYAIQLIPAFNSELFPKVTFLTAYLALPLWVMFVQSLFKPYISVRSVRIAQYGCLLLSIIVIAAPFRWFDRTLVLFGALCLLLIPYMAAGIVRAWRKGVEGAGLFLAGFGLYMLFAVHDLFSLVSLSQYGTLLFVFIQSTILASQFARSFTEVERLSDKLLVLDKLKDEFLANTSHELRTPLNGMVGITESLIDGSAGPLPEEAVKQLRLMKSSGMRLTHLVNDILDFSEIKHGSVLLRPVTVNVSEMTETVFLLLKPLVSGKSLELLNEVPPDLFVTADEGRLQQILINLIGNAITYSEHGTVAVRGYRGGGFASIEVRDTGIGIPEDQLEYIFESFGRVERSLHKKYRGTGLGLAITKKLVQLHGGQIGAESSPGAGSVFRFTLPAAGKPQMNRMHSAAAAALVQADAIESSPRPGNGLSSNAGDKPIILIVDDDLINLQVFYNYLHFSFPDYQVIESDNGSEALQWIDEGLKPTIILLDIMMPHLSGYRFCREVRQRYSAAEVPVLFLTAKHQIEDITAGFACGANDYMIKPVEKGELLARVNMHLKLAQWNLQLEKEIQERTLLLHASYEETAAALAEKSVLEERSRIARDIHDNVGHVLTATIIQIEAGTMLLEHAPAEAAAFYAKAGELVRLGLNEIRQSVRMLGSDLDRLGLIPSLLKMIDETKKNGFVSFDYEIDDNLPPLNRQQQTALFHALQEGITNGIRHGRCRQFRFELRLLNDTLSFTLDNDGTPYENKPFGFGLKAMGRRVREAGGRLEIGHTGGAACRLSITMPLQGVIP